MSSTVIALISAISVLLGVVVGTGGLALWFKIGPERKKIVIEVAQDAVVIQSAVVKTLREENVRMSDELLQCEMERKGLEHQRDTYRQLAGEQKLQIAFMQREVDLAQLARRRSHAAQHTAGAYELLIDNVLAYMSEHHLEILPEHRPYALRTAFHTEMAKLEQVEAEIVPEALKLKPPETTPGRL